MAHVQLIATASKTCYVFRVIPCILRCRSLEMPPRQTARRARALVARMADDEDALIAALQGLWLEHPQATAKELHALLPDHPSVSLGAVKKAASKAAKRGLKAEVAVVAEVGGDVVRSPLYTPFDVGSTVIHLDGRKLKVLKCKGGRVSTQTTDKQRTEVPQEELVLFDTPRHTCPTAYDLIVQSPSVGRVDRCDTLAEIISERAAPPQLMLRPWDSFSACAKNCETGTIEGMVTHPESAWKVPDGVPEAPSRFVCFALDAVAHHLTIEWRVGRGWRLLQSYMKNPNPKHETSGYTALEWATSGQACGGADPSVHRRFGQGRWLSDAEMLEFLRAILHLRGLTDALVADCLLQQAPFEIGPRPAEDDKEALPAWLQSLGPVKSWAEEKIAAAETSGATLLGAPGADVQVVLGVPADGGEVESLLRISEADAAAVDAAYTAVTGEAFPAIGYLHLLHYVESDRILYETSAEDREKRAEQERLFAASQLQSNSLRRTGSGATEERSFRGWAVRSMHWAQD